MYMFGYTVVEYFSLRYQFYKETLSYVSEHVEYGVRGYKECPCAFIITTNIKRW